MSIARHLDGGFTPEQRRVLEIAYNSALRKLNLVDRDDPVCALVAQRMIAIYRRGVTDAAALCERTVREVGPDQS